MSRLPLSRHTWVGANHPHTRLYTSERAAYATAFLGKGNGFKKRWFHAFKPLPKNAEKLQRPNPLQLLLLLPDHRPRVKVPPCAKPPLSASDRTSVSTGNGIQTGSRDGFRGFRGGCGLSQRRPHRRGLGTPQGGLAGPWWLQIHLPPVPRWDCG